jgi:hypothetical protein
MRSSRRILRTSASTYPITRQDEALFVDATSTVSLPSAVGFKQILFTIKKMFSGGTVVISAPAGQTIDGNASYTLTNQYQYVAVISDGANWGIVENN